MTARHGSAIFDDILTESQPPIFCGYGIDDHISVAPEACVSNGITNEAFTRSQNELNKQDFKKYSENEARDKNDNTKGNGEPDTDLFRSLVPFCMLFGIGNMLTSSLVMYLTSQITVLERAYGLSSSKSGVLLSANDAGFVITVLFTSHFLKNHHIPRILAVCVLVFGLSGMLTSLPHFIDEHDTTENSALANSTGSDSSHLCVPGFESNLTAAQKCEQENEEIVRAEAGKQWVVIFIGAMMIAQGVAKAPRSSLSMVYLDNNSHKDKTGFYIGLLQSFTILGPFVAFIVGGFINQIPVDLQYTNMTMEDPRWIGAWWLGFLIFGACALVISFPMFFLPATLRREQPDSQTEYANTAIVEGPAFIDALKDMPKSVFRVVKKPVYFCNLMSVLCIMYAIFTFITFGPKYMENQFHISTSKANIIIGVQRLLTTVTGTLLGGIIVRRLRLKLSGCVKMVIMCRCLEIICNSFNFMLGCDNLSLTGFDGGKKHASPVPLASNNSSGILESCDCSDVSYLPMCADGITFFSPCHAGCETESNGMYSNCSATESNDVISGICDTGCSLLLPYLLVNALSSLVVNLTVSPIYVCALRSVGEEDRSMSVGLMSFCVSLLLFLPAPILYGKIFDSTCLVWSHNACTTTLGSCSLYDITDMRFRLVSLNVGFTFASMLFVVAMLVFVRKAERTDTLMTMFEQMTSVQPPMSLV